MPDRPLLFFANRAEAPRKSKHGGGDRVVPLSREQHRQRVGERLATLEQQLIQKSAWFQHNAISTAPNTVLVLELATSVANFSKAAAKLNFPVIGEWAGEEVDAEEIGRAHV